MLVLTPARISFLIAGVAAASVGGALVFEHVFGYVPCMLCLWQRWPYYLGAPVALLAGALALRGQYGGTKLLLAAAGLLFLGGAGLGIYHAGVEWSFWPGPTSCAGANAAPTSAGGLMDQMRTVRIVPCDSAAWRFLGLSLAGYNALIATGLAGLAFLGLAKRTLCSCFCASIVRTKRRPAIDSSTRRLCAMSVTFSLFERVAYIGVEKPDLNLKNGDIGSVIEIWGNDFYEVEFFDRNGITFEMSAFHASDLAIVADRAGSSNG